MNQLIWALPGFVHTLIWKISGWRLIRYQVQNGCVYYRWVDHWPN